MIRAALIFLVLVGVGASFLSTGKRSAAGNASTNDRVIAVNGAQEPGKALSSLETGQDAGGAVTLQRQPDGHFYADVQINAQPVHMLIDTGASGIALSRDDAHAAGIATSIGMNDVIGEGAGGAVRGEWVMIDRVTLGPKTAEHVPATVLSGGEQSLLGQSFLKQFAAVEIHGDTMSLR